MAMDPETGEPMISVEEDDTVAPESMEAFTKEQLQGDLTNMMEEVESNPPKKLFTWKNLRLQSAIAGSRTAKGRISGAIGAAGTFFGRGISFSLREIPSRNQSEMHRFCYNLPRQSSGTITSVTWRRTPSIWVLSCQLWLHLHRRFPWLCLSRRQKWIPALRTS